MADEKAVGFTRRDAERILDTLSRVEGTPSSIIPPVDRSRTFSETASLPFKNNSGETIPPFGCFRIALSVNYSTQNRSLIKAVKPKTNLQGYDIGVNGANPCAAGKVGQMQTTYTVKVRFAKAAADLATTVYPYAGLSVGALDDFSVNSFGYDFICRGIAGEFNSTTNMYSHIIATPIPKTSMFPVQLECTNDSDSKRGSATQQASLMYNVRYLKNENAQVDTRIPILSAREQPKFTRPLLGRVQPATQGIAMWQPFDVTGSGASPRKLDIVYSNERSEFTTC
tara:strand:+ start:9078 stop:9926 length:849 start_codon:yes stop_codon:yes gene_type:complete